MKAELTPNRKGVRCPACHRFLAARWRQPEGSFLIFVKAGRGGWEPKKRDGRQRLERNWQRLESGRPTRRHLASTGPGWVAWSMPVTVLCGCDREVELDPLVLDASLRASLPDQSIGYDGTITYPPDDM